MDDGDDRAYRRGVAPTIAQRIKETRKAKGLSQTALAKRLGRLRAGDVSHWETGARRPTKQTLDAIAKALGVSYATLDPDGHAWNPETPRSRAEAPGNIGANLLDSSAQLRQDRASTSITKPEVSVMSHKDPCAAWRELVPADQWTTFARETTRRAYALWEADQEAEEHIGKRKRVGGRG